MKTPIKKPLRTASNALLLCGGLLAIVNGLSMIAPPLAWIAGGAFMVSVVYHDYRKPPNT